MKIFYYKNEYPPKIVRMDQGLTGSILEKIELTVEEILTPRYEKKLQDILIYLTLKFPPDALDIRIVNKYS